MAFTTARATYLALLRWQDKWFGTSGKYKPICPIPFYIFEMQERKGISVSPFTFRNDSLVCANYDQEKFNCFIFGIYPLRAAACVSAQVIRRYSPPV